MAPNSNTALQLPALIQCNLSYPTLLTLPLTLKLPASPPLPLSLHCSIACAAAVSYVTYSSLDLLKGLPYWVAAVLCVLGGACSLFCAYNVMAGGNPPPKKKAAGKAE